VGEHTVTRAWPKLISKGASRDKSTVRSAKCYTGWERYVERVSVE
jgi:hypothetical protein